MTDETAAAGLALRVDRRPGGAVVVACDGELDLDTAGEFEAAVREAFGGGRTAPAARVVVDCSELFFCDSSGLNALLRLRQSATDKGIGMCLAAVPEGVLRLLRVTGVSEVLDCRADVEGALVD